MLVPQRGSDVGALPVDHHKAALGQRHRPITVRGVVPRASR
jgi:hypothetical protein